MSKLVNIIRTLVREELGEAKQGRLSKGLVIADQGKADKIKQLYPESHWIHKMINIIEDADFDVTRLGYKDPETGEFVKGLSQILDIRHTYINPQIKELIINGVLADKSETAIPKVAKPESTGQRGRKPSEKSKEGIIRALYAKFQENPNYEPSEEDLTYNLPKGLGTEKLSPEILNKVKNQALGTVKRGRPVTGKSDLLSKVQKVLGSKDTESLSEAFLRLHKSKK